MFIRNLLLALSFALALTFGVACGDDPTTPNQGSMIDNDNNGIPDNNGHDNNGTVINNGTVDGFSVTISLVAPDNMSEPWYGFRFYADPNKYDQWDENEEIADCKGPICTITAMNPGVYEFELRSNGYLAIPKTFELTEADHDTSHEFTWDNQETPGQYGLAPVGTYKDPLDSSFVIDFESAVSIYEGGSEVVLGSRGQLPSAVISGNHFEWLGAEAPASFTGTISDDLRVIETRYVNGWGDEFFQTLEIVGDPIDPVTGQPYKKNP